MGVYKRKRGETIIEFKCEAENKQNETKHESKQNKHKRKIIESTNKQNRNEKEKEIDVTKRNNSKVLAKLAGHFSVFTN